MPVFRYEGTGLIQLEVAYDSIDYDAFYDAGDGVSFRRPLVGF